MKFDCIYAKFGVLASLVGRLLTVYAFLGALFSFSLFMKAYHFTSIMVKILLFSLILLLTIVLFAYLYNFRAYCYLNKDGIEYRSLLKSRTINLRELKKILYLVDGSFYEYTLDFKPYKYNKSRDTVYIVFTSNEYLIGDNISYLRLASEDYIAIEWQPGIKQIISEYYNSWLKV